jgi:hypothetical protein
VESLIRQAVRDAVNRNSRKPFYWGGLKGYQQLQAIAQGLHQYPANISNSSYLDTLIQQVERVLEKNCEVAEDLKAAHQALCQVAACFHYPPQPVSALEMALPNGGKLNSLQVAQQVNDWIKQFYPDGKLHYAQSALYSALRKYWKQYSQELLYCYDIPGLPQDNLQLEALFGRLRRHQRRISGRKSTRELYDFGQAQILVQANSEADLLTQIQQISRKDYLVHRQRLAKAEAPRQFYRHLHHNTLDTVLALVYRHAIRSNFLSH